MIRKKVKIATVHRDFEKEAQEVGVDAEEDEIADMIQHLRRDDLVEIMQDLELPTAEDGATEEVHLDPP